MADAITELAMLFKTRDNKSNGFDNFIIGTIASPTPNPRIQIGDSIVLEKEDLIFTVHNLEAKREVNNEIVNFTTQLDYKTGEKVCLIPSQNNETFLVIGKAVQY